MKKTIKTMLVTILLVMQITSISADTERYSDFTVKPIYTENQIGSQSDQRGYFDILLSPGNSEILPIEIKNTGNSVMTVHMDTTNAVTRDNGEADYTQADKPSDFIPYTMDSILRVVENDVTVQPGETIIMNTELTMPEESIDGVILGGLSLTATHETNKKKEENSVGVTSSVKYLVAVQARNSLDIVKPHLNSTQSGIKVYDFVPAYYVTLENTTGANLTKTTITGDIKQKKDGKVVANVSEAQKNILPHSSFDVVFTSTDSKRITAQEYIYDLKITTENDEWVFSNTISVDDSESEKINEGIKKDNEMLPIYIGGILLVLLNIIVVIFLLKRKNIGSKS